MISYLEHALKKFSILAKTNHTLIMAILAYLIITPIDSILYLQWINAMVNYKWMAGAVIFPFVGLMFFALPTLWLIYKHTININYPKKELALIGSMDSIGSIMGAVTIPFISIILSVIIYKLVLPATMIASYYFLKKRYVWSHYLGVSITIFGILASAVPKLVLGTDQTSPIAMIFYILSIIPGVASYVIKEIYLKKYPDANPWFLNSVITIYQVGIGFLALPLVMLPITGFNVKPEHFGSYIGNSLKCQFGYNSNEGDDCTYSLLFLILYQIASTASNILMFVIIREGSSVIFIMINTLKTPITALMGYYLIYYNLITYTKQESFTLTWLDFVSLVFVVIGSIFYGLNKENDFLSDSDKEGYFSLDKQGILTPFIINDDEIIGETNL